MLYILSRAKLFSAIAFFAIMMVSTGGAAEPRQYAVEVSAAVEENPPRITLNWRGDGSASSYQVFRKDPNSSSWGSSVSLPGSASSYSDSGVSLGVTYEYQVQKSGNTVYPGYGYITAAVRGSLVDARGKVVLIVDNTYAADLAAELSRLQEDLTGDGWTVLRHDVSRQDSVPSVKSKIKADYDADPGGVKAVFLFGRVPVPYSGDFNPDNHPDHRGAWPADVYYGDMDGSWTDSYVNNGGADRAQNRNVPGDGKFDQSDLPSDVELQVGRVDLSNMTCFSNKSPSRSEKDLLRQYLNKDHNFRHGLFSIERRGIVCDNFGERSGEAFAASGWRSFAPMFGANTAEVAYGQYFPTVNSQGYLWSYGTGGGGYWTCNGIGSSDDFANGDVKSVFTMFFGSYFGDWDNESNFLRAPLGSSSYTLTALWAGRPHCFLHHMGLGETIGFSTRVSQNNRNGGVYSVQNYGTHQAHVALMGDPTLRLHPVAPPRNLTKNGNSLSWGASPDSDIQGYHVYRSASGGAPFIRVTGSLLGQTSFTDNSGSGSEVYMVRAVKLERSGSGTYLNPSQGIFSGGVSSGGGGGGVGETAPGAPSSPTVSVGSDSQLRVGWIDNASNETGFRIERKVGLSGSFQQITEVGANSTAFTDNGLASGTAYFYRIRAYNSAGVSAFTPDVGATTTTLVSALATPGALTVTVLSSSQIRVDWGDPSSAESGFKIERKTGIEGSFQQITEVGANATSFTDSGLAAGNTYYYRVRAYTAVALSEFTQDVGATTANVVVGSARASFVKIDSTTRGAWRGVYGAEGYTIIDNAQVSPGFIQISPEGQSAWTWAASTSNDSALLKDGSGDRIASCWYSPATFSVGINVSDTASHRIAFYCMDWSSTDRVQTMEVIDVSTGAILDQQTLSGFNGGKYVVWDIQGNVRVRLTRQSGANAVLSGIFIDPAQTGVVVSNPSVQTVTRKFQLRLSGQVGQKFLIEASTDCLEWAAISTNVLASTSLDFVDAKATQYVRRFYRSRLIP